MSQFPANKICTKCKMEFANTSEFFHMAKNKLEARCKTCRNAAGRHWRLHGPKFRKHEMHGWTGTLTYNSWKSMRCRCNIPSSKEYPRYGGRGISYTTRWNSFNNFLADMGVRPEGTTLDRIDNNKNYTKSNCRWATWIEQNNNKSKCRYYDYKGQKLTLAQLARQYEVPATTLYYRLKRGLSMSEALAEVGEA